MPSSSHPAEHIPAAPAASPTTGAAATQQDETRRAPRAGAPRRPRTRAASARRPRTVAQARWASPEAETTGPAHLHQVLPAPFDRTHGERKFITRLGTMGWRAESCAIAVSEVYSFADWLANHAPGGACDVRTVTARTVTDYRTWLFGLNLSVATVRLALVCLRLYYDFITGQKGSPDNPARAVLLPHHDLPALTPYTTSEVRTILHAVTRTADQAQADGDVAAWMLAERDYAMLCTLYYCGIRRGELRRLRLRDLDLRAGDLRIKGKGEKARTVAIPRVLGDVLARYLHQVRGETSPAAFVFCELDHTTAGWFSAGPDADTTAGRFITPQVREQARREDDDYGLGPQTLARRGNHYGRLAGVDGHHGPHRWRHTFATNAATCGMPLEDIAKYLGHSVGKRQNGLGWNPITLDYIHLPADYLHQVVNAALPDPWPTASPTASR